MGASNQKIARIYFVLVLATLFLHAVFLLLNWHRIVLPQDSPLYMQGAPYGGRPARFEFGGFYVPAVTMPALLIIASNYRIFVFSTTLSLSIRVLIFAASVVLTVFCLALSFLKMRGLFLTSMGPTVVIFLSLTIILLSFVLLVRPRSAGDRLFGITNLIALLFSLFVPLMGLHLFED
jgi:hypothetical protein